MSFDHFRQTIHIAGNWLGGTTGARKAIAGHAIAYLGFQLEDSAPRDRRHEARSEWWRATDEELEQAADNFMKHLQHNGTSAEPAVAEAAWENAHLRLRGDGIYIEGGDLGLRIAFISEHQVYDSKTRGNVTKWQVFISDAGVTAAARGYGSTPNKSTNAGSVEGAIKAMRRLVEQFFNVKMEDVAHG